MKCDSPGFAVELLNELVRAFLAAADTRSQVYCSASIEYLFDKLNLFSYIDKPSALRHVFNAA